MWPIAQKKLPDEPGAAEGAKKAPPRRPQELSHLVSPPKMESLLVNPSCSRVFDTIRRVPSQISFDTELLCRSCDARDALEEAAAHRLNH